MRATKGSIPLCRDRAFCTEKQITKLIGKRRTWVKKELQLMQIKVEWVVHNNGNPLVFYAPCVVTYLRLMSQLIPPAGNWLTRNQVIDVLNCGLTWRTASKLLDPYLSYARPKRDSRNRVQLHYPLHAVEKIRADLARKLEESP